MRKKIYLQCAVLILPAFVFSLLIAGCKKEPESAQVKKGENLEADSHPIKGGKAWLAPAVLDTLRLKKKLYEVTRDEYWDKRGGVLANSNFEVWYPPGRVTVTHGMYLLEQAELARRKFKRIFGTIPQKKICIITTTDLDAYLKRTGREWWYYSQINGDTLIFQPIYILVKRGLAPIAVAHEYSQWAIRNLSGGRAPRWMEEGLASYISGEEKIAVGQIKEFKDMRLERNLEEIEETLKLEKERPDTRIAYYHSYKMAKNLIEDFGMEDISAFIKKLGEGRDIGQASQEALGVSYKDVLDDVTTYEIDR